MTSQPPFPITLFAQLVHRLRHANARYDVIAYQCRHTQRRTHHAERRARRVGLSIDTDKARAAFQQPRCGPEAHLWALASGVRSVWESPSPVWTDEDPGLDVLDMDSRGDEPEGEAEGTFTLETHADSEWGPLALRQRTDEMSPALRLSPLDLALRTVDDEDVKDSTVPLPPGAPRWKTKPLPSFDSDVVAGSARAVLKVARTCDSVPVRRGLGRGVVCTAHTLNASESLPMMLADAAPYCPITLGITVLTRPLKRKLRDIDVDVLHSVCPFGDRDSRCR